jgi:hypothetical protein
MISFENVTIGADPEVFVLNGKNGKYSSAHIFKAGTKDRPKAIPHGFVQVDGLALEFNTPPTQDKNEFISSITGCLQDLTKIVKASSKNFRLEATPVVGFNKKYLKSLPREVRALGCNPDWNAYTMDENPIPDAEKPFRTGSGHIHVGFTENADVESASHLMDCAKLARQMDYYLGLPSLEWDPDPVRRQLYGKAGAFRAKVYGMEYRVLSNRWLSRPELVAFVFDQTMKACSQADKGNFLDELYVGYAQKVINENQVDWAKTFPQLSRMIRGDIRFEA